MAEDCVTLPERSITDVWSEAAARRALGFLAIGKVGTRLRDIRIDPFPVEAPGRSLKWLCFGPQDDVDDWRTSDAHAFAITASVERWLRGDFLSRGAALAAEFPLPALAAAVFSCLDAREHRVLRRRAADETLEAVAADYGVTRERVRQIESRAIETLTTRIVALKAIRHPAVLALFAHADRLAAIVLEAASKEEAVLVEGRKRHWLRKVLAPFEAEFLQILTWLADGVEPELRPRLDPLGSAGRPFQGGRTALAWRDDDVAALKSGFAAAVDGRGSRWVDLETVCRTAKLDRAAVAALAGFADLTVRGDRVFEGRLKVGDERRALASGVLAGADRAMHTAEVLEGVASLGLDSEAALRELQRALSEDQKTYASDGRALWQLKSRLGDVVEDRRPECPPLPPPMSDGTLADALAALKGEGQTAAGAVLDGLDPDQGAFAIHAGRRLASVLCRLPDMERRSMAQILRPSDGAKLLAWLGQTPVVAHAADAAAEPWHPRVLVGLTVLASFVSAIRAAGRTDEGHWTAVLDACGEEARRWLFNSQQAPRMNTQGRLVEAAAALKLRRAFSFRSDPWMTLLTLQAGLLPGDLDALPRWLGSSQPPVAIQQLVAPGPNHSASMACTWNTLQAYRRGRIGREAVEAVSRHSDWWPGWSPEEACRACARVLHSRPAPETAVQHGPVSRPQTEDGVEVVPAAEEATPVWADRRPTDRPSARHAWGVAFDTDGPGFTVALPERLDLPAGPIALRGEGVRVGGEVQEDRSVRWYAEQPRIRLALRGPPERILRIERGSGVLASHSVRFWAAEDYIGVFPLAPKRGRLIDPFVSPLPRTGGLALLLHRSLRVSAEADEDHGLDASYVLLVFRSGLPAGTTVSCGDEVVWQAEDQAEPHRVATGLTASLTLDGTSARWGATADLVLSHPPAGFTPRRACVGAQTMAAQPDGEGWRFPGFMLLPGMDSLRRGRVDGVLAGERTSLPAEVLLAHAPVGAALRDGQGWRPLDPSGCFLAAKDAKARLWACLPDLDGNSAWTVFEGPREAYAHSRQGVVLDRHLLGLGEPLSLAPGRFNVGGTSIPLARSVCDTGGVGACEPLGGAMRLRLVVPIEWTERHKALAWSERGIVELQPVPRAEGPSDLTFSLPEGDVDGICLFHGGAWLGTAFLAGDAAAATDALLVGAPGWPDTLRLAVAGRLPVLADDVRTKVGARLREDGGRGLLALCRVPPNAATDHALGRLLEAWEPGRKLSGALVEEFLKMGTDGAAKAPLLARLMAAAPCSAMRGLMRGLETTSGRDRRRIVVGLVESVMSGDARCVPAEAPDVRFGAEVERALLAQVIEATGLDHNFLASRVEASIASLAWANASAASHTRHDPNLATALTLPPIRRWLAVHLLNKLAAHLR